MAIENENGEREFRLPEGYRVGGTEEEIDALKYFFSRMVPACNPSKNNFRYEKGKKMISDIFSISNEAFALLVLYNESHRWRTDAKKKLKKRVFGEVQNTTASQPDRTEQNKKKKESPKERKKFTDARSGNRKGWLVEGRKLYQDLCMKVNKLRKNTCTGERVEEKLQMGFAIGDGIDSDEWKDKNESFSPTSTTSVQLSGYLPNGLKSFFGEV